MERKQFVVDWLSVSESFTTSCDWIRVENQPEGHAIQNRWTTEVCLELNSVHVSGFEDNEYFEYRF